MSESRERKGFFGRYSEHLDDDGEKVGESRQQQGFFGDYEEHTDAEGNKLGESRARDGFFGDFVEHEDADGRIVGESRERDGFFGPYVEHTDADGNKIGESREREGVFGNYTDHTGSRHHEAPANEETSDGFFDWLGEKMAAVGFVLGAILGLLAAIDSADSVMGYLLYTGIGAFAGAIIAAMFAAILPWAIGLGAIVLVLKACGVA